MLLAPVGALRLQHPDGVLAAVAAAAAYGTACAISPAAGHSLKEIPVPPGSVLWYQVTTALGGRDVAERQLEQARARGYQAVDSSAWTPGSGRRARRCGWTAHRAA